MKNQIIVTLTNEQSEEYFYNALCNGAGQLSSSGLEITHRADDYSAAKKELIHVDNKEGVCYEDVWMKILRMGKELRIEDVESGEYNRSITLADVHARVYKTPMVHLNDMITEQDDAITADAIIQTVFFEDIIFG